MLLKLLKLANDYNFDVIIKTPEFPFDSAEDKYGIELRRGTKACYYRSNNNEANRRLNECGKTIEEVAEKVIKAISNTYITFFDLNTETLYVPEYPMEVDSND